MSSDELETFSVPCPCCKAELVIDLKTRSILHHAVPVHSPPITDFAAEVSRLRSAPAEREQAFQRSLEAERTRETRMDRKFDELLRRAKQSPNDKPLKDTDL